MSTSVRIVDEFRNDRKKIRTHTDEMPDERAALAVQLMGNMAMVSGEPDGYDEAGRAKVKLMAPGDVAQRACAIADAAFQQFKDRGWMLQMPSHEEYWKAVGVDQPDDTEE